MFAKVKQAKEHPDLEWHLTVFATDLQDSLLIFKATLPEGRVRQLAQAIDTGRQWQDARRQSCI